MDILKKYWWVIAGVALYFVLKPRLSGVSGLGVGGRPRMGRPKTEAERAAEHARRFGGPLPPRGTGIRRRWM